MKARLASWLRAWASHLDGRVTAEFPPQADVTVSIGPGVVSVTARHPEVTASVKGLRQARTEVLGGGGGGGTLLGWGDDI